MKSFILEIHKPETLWFKRQEDLFYIGVGCGVFTVLILRERWTKLAANLKEQLQRLRGEAAYR